MLSSDEEKIVEEVKGFVKQAFIENPHFSFHDWTVMYDHSCNVESIAHTIAQSVACDELLVAVGALLHDVGKTYKADEKTLHLEHETFNLPVSETFLDMLDIPRPRLEKLKKLVAFEDEGIEMQIIKEADVLAFPSDKRLYMLYIEWAFREGHESSIQRKLEKFDKLQLAVSKKMGEPLFRNMEKDWHAYGVAHSS
ncbi:MAG: HD domain-containing protein [Candidatus Moraniibacteriota bacterium]